MQPTKLTLRRRSTLSAPLDLAATARTALTLRQPIVVVAPRADDVTALKQRVSLLEGQLATAQRQQAEKAHREDRVASMTIHETDNRAAYALKTAGHVRGLRAVITTNHVDVL